MLDEMSNFMQYLLCMSERDDTWKWFLTEDALPNIDLYLALRGGDWSGITKMYGTNIHSFWSYRISEVNIRCQVCLNCRYVLGCLGCGCGVSFFSFKIFPHTGNQKQPDKHVYQNEILYKTYLFLRDNLPAVTETKFSQTSNTLLNVNNVHLPNNCYSLT